MQMTLKLYTTDPLCFEPLGLIVSIRAPNEPQPSGPFLRKSVKITNTEYHNRLPIDNSVVIRVLENKLHSQNPILAILEYTVLSTAAAVNITEYSH